jgi:hypothetical protein
LTLYIYTLTPTLKKNNNNNKIKYLAPPNKMSDSVHDYKLYENMLIQYITLKEFSLRTLLVDAL